MDIKDGNVLIAHFMGILTDGDRTSVHYGSKLLVYHSSWDWLMPVVDKIRQEYKKKDRMPDEITEWCHVTGLLICTPIAVVFEAVIKFIKWYNTKL